MPAADAAVLVHDQFDAAELELDDRRRSADPAGLHVVFVDDDTEQQRHVGHDELVDDIVSVLVVPFVLVFVFVAFLVAFLVFDASGVFVVEHDQLAVRVDDFVLVIDDEELTQPV